MTSKSMPTGMTYGKSHDKSEERMHPEVKLPSPMKTDGLSHRKMGSCSVEAKTAHNEMGIPK